MSSASFFSVLFVAVVMLWLRAVGVMSLQCSFSTSSSLTRASQGLIVAVLSPVYTCTAFIIFWLVVAAWMKWRQRRQVQLFRYHTWHESKPVVVHVLHVLFDTWCRALFADSDQMAV